MKLIFHPAAEDELNAAVDWYEQRQSGLGLDLAIEVHAATGLALTMPEAWSEIAPGIRRVLTQRFPYGVLYSVEGDVLFVLAVMHLSQGPVTGGAGCEIQPAAPGRSGPRRCVA